LVTPNTSKRSSSKGMILSSKNIGNISKNSADKKKEDSGVSSVPSTQDNRGNHYVNNGN